MLAKQNISALLNWVFVGGVFCFMGAIVLGFI